MVRKIKYKPVSKELEEITKPKKNSSIRSGIGLEKAVGEFFFILVEDLVPFENQARKIFSDDNISSLADSIRDHGIRQPLTVLRKENSYEVISGERRLRAAKMIGLDKVPCILLEEENDVDAVALIENIQREDLHPLELGNIYRKLLSKNIYNSQSELAEKISIPKSKISEYIKYSEIPSYVQKFIIDNKISAREKLREISKACENNDREKIDSILGITKKNYSNFSILRIRLNKNNMVFQTSGVKKLDNADKRKLKNFLIDLADSIHIE